MKDSENLNLEKFNQTWADVSDEITALAKKHEGNIEALLSLLRLLESLHKEIRDGLFQESLPDNRQALYSLLKDIEASGGWPYIYRGSLNSLMSRLPGEEVRDLLNPIDPEQKSGNLSEDR